MPFQVKKAQGIHFPVGAVVGVLSNEQYQDARREKKKKRIFFVMHTWYCSIFGWWILLQTNSNLIDCIQEHDFYVIQSFFNSEKNKSFKLYWPI